MRVPTSLTKEDGGIGASVRRYALEMLLHFRTCVPLTGLSYSVNIQIKPLQDDTWFTITLYGLTVPLCLCRISVRIRQVPDGQPKEQKHDQKGCHSLERGLTGLPIEDRFLASAQRILYEDPNNKEDVGQLRRHQIPAFSSFRDYLLDLATSPETTSLPPYCRIILPPRTGKTVVAGRIIAWAGLCSTFVVPTKVLVRQTLEELRRQIPGIPIGLYYSEIKQPVSHGVNITTYATLQRHFSSGTLPEAIRTSALLFLDEAHHTITSLRMETLQNAFEAKAIRIALTATPDYDHRRRLHQFFPQLIHETDLLTAFETGLLAPTRMWVAEVDVDASVVRFVAGDYEAETLGRLMSSSPFFKAVEVFRYSGSNLNLPALVACASRQQAYDLWTYLQEHKPSSRPMPGLILGDTPPKERQRLLTGFERGHVDTLIQVGVLIEGWNAPCCKLLLDLAPSLSRVRATQKYFRVMTRYKDQEARIVVILPKHLPRQPILPTDLLLKPGESYMCGDLLHPEDEHGAKTKKSIDRTTHTPIKSVKVKTRIIATAKLGRPALNPNNPDEILRVLASCPDFNSSLRLGRSGFRKLVFRHSLFVGTGDALLRYLGVPNDRKAYAAFLAGLFPSEPGDQVLEGDHGFKGEIRRSCLDDFESIRQAALEPNDNKGKPRESHMGALRALCGGLREIASPEEILLIREQIAQVFSFMKELQDRQQYTLIHRLGLFGTSESTWDEIGIELGISKERVRQIFWKAIRILAHRYRTRARDRHPMMKSVLEYPNLLEILPSQAYPFP